MTMTGEQWLDRVFRPAVSIADRARGLVVQVDPMKVLGERLAAQVEALGHTGVLTDEQESAAFDSLEAAGILPEAQSRSASMSATGVVAGTAARITISPAPDGPPRLLGVLPGPRELGPLDGRPVVLIAAELWSDRFLVDLYADPGPEFRAGRARATREQLEWVRRLRRGGNADRPRGGGGHPVPRLHSLAWELRDGHGTEYDCSEVTAEASDYLARRRLRFAPAPWAGADPLTLFATDDTGAVVFTAGLPRPAG
jgi:hypothetical protein